MALARTQTRAAFGAYRLEQLGDSQCRFACTSHGTDHRFCGRPAVHRRFAQLHRGSGWHGDTERFGMAGAVLAGDLCLSWSDEVLTSCGLPPESARPTSSPRTPVHRACHRPRGAGSLARCRPR